ncbi:MAG: V-type ATP synthase subunit F [Treponema sp.]|nr:V-type ATP synthase subunit F [Treponema sp.]
MDFYFIGDEELVTAFRFIGIDGMTVRNADEAVAVFRQITEGINAAGLDLPDSFPDNENCQVLILTEETADWLGAYMIEWQLSGLYPLLVEIPGIAGRLKGRKTLVDAIREAIGIRV